MKLYGDRKVTFGKFSRDVLVLSVLTVLTQYGNYFPSFASISTGCLAALGSSSLLFVFVSSVAFLRIQVIAAKVISKLCTKGHD